jgi:hypothetical protein
VLRTSEAVVKAELTRYGDSKEVESLYAEQERLRPLVERERAAERELWRKGAQSGPSAKSIEAVREAQARVDAAKTDVAAERAREARSHLILKDEELSSKSLDAASPGRCSSRISGTLAGRGVAAGLWRSSTACRGFQNAPSAPTSTMEKRAFSVRIAGGPDSGAGRSLHATSFRPLFIGRPREAGTAYRRAAAARLQAVSDLDDRVDCREDLSP